MVSAEMTSVIRKLAAIAVLAIVACPALSMAEPAPSVAADFQIVPAEVRLEGNYARAQLLVTTKPASGAIDDRSADLTHAATYVSTNPQIVTVNKFGRLLAIANGGATVTVTHGAISHPVVVHVSGVVPDPKIGFREQVVPILAKAGCNAGACHAAQYGKGGFKLSVFGFAPEDDYNAIVRDQLSRRVSFIHPQESLLLMKGTATVPHGGDRRLQPGSIDYQMLEKWLAAQAPNSPADAPKVTGIKVHPARRVGQPGLTQQLQVFATYSDGKTRDVTAWTRFDSMDDAVLKVNSDGKVTVIGRGQAPAMARFEGQAAIAMMVIPYAETVDLAGWVDQNFIDTLAAAKFKELGISPSPLCDDATFLRRAFLDSIGTVPSVEESVAFLDSKDPDKRKKLIDRLLGLTGDPAQDIYNNQYAAYWSLKWSDLIRSNSANIGEQGMWALHNWIVGSFRENRPFDRFVQELITAKGSVYMNGPANYFRIANNPQDLTETTSQLFLGVRMQCAKCHHHPYENISQADYYGLAAFFSRVGVKTSQEFGLFGAEQVVMVRSDGEVAHPRTGQIMKPTPLHGQPVEPPLDRRVPLASWLTAQDNHFFPRNVVNRYFDYLLGRGLVEPVDDMRATNPPSNEAMMNAVADSFVKSGFNLKQLLRLIMNSRLYQLDSQPTSSNAADHRFYSYYHVKRLPAEALLDAIDAVTSVQTKYDKLPLGTRAIELPDANHNNFFLKTFGKPPRLSVCECERVSSANLAQALHTLNGDTVATKIAATTSRVAKLMEAKLPLDDAVTQLYLAALCRRPSPEELAACRTLAQQTGDPKVFYEDLLWSLTNSKQFLFVR